jgi:membrane protein implicated in regulation of membrane protease activity
VTVHQARIIPAQGRFDGRRKHHRRARLVLRWQLILFTLAYLVVLLTFPAYAPLDIALILVAWSVPALIGALAYRRSFARRLRPSSRSLLTAIQLDPRRDIA